MINQLPPLTTESFSWLAFILGRDEEVRFNEASSLGLKPGYFPDKLRIDYKGKTLMYTRFQTDKSRSGEIQRVVYVVETTGVNPCTYLVVYND